MTPDGAVGRCSTGQQTFPPPPAAAEPSGPDLSGGAMTTLSTRTSVVNCNGHNGCGMWCRSLELRLRLQDGSSDRSCRLVAAWVIRNSGSARQDPSSK